MTTKLYTNMIVEIYFDMAITRNSIKVMVTCIMMCLCSLNYAQQDTIVTDTYDSVEMTETLIKSGKNWMSFIDYVNTRRHPENVTTMIRPLMQDVDVCDGYDDYVDTYASRIPDFNVWMILPNGNNKYELNYGCISRPIEFKVFTIQDRFFRLASCLGAFNYAMMKYIDHNYKDSSLIPIFDSEECKYLSDTYRAKLNNLTNDSIEERSKLEKWITALDTAHVRAPRVLMLEKDSMNISYIKKYKSEHGSVYDDSQRCYYRWGVRSWFRIGYTVFYDVWDTRIGGITRQEHNFCCNKDSYDKWYITDAYAFYEFWMPQQITIVKVEKASLIRRLINKMKFWDDY